MLAKQYLFLSSGILSLHLGVLSGNQKILPEPIALLEILLRPERLSWAVDYSAEFQSGTSLSLTVLYETPYSTGTPYSTSKAPFPTFPS